VASFPFRFHVPDDGSPELSGFIAMVMTTLDSPDLMRLALETPDDRARLFSDERGERLFIVDERTIYRPEDFDRLSARLRAARKVSSRPEGEGPNER
jgi:hypothetical protein